MLCVQIILKFEHGAAAARPQRTFYQNHNCADCILLLSIIGSRLLKITLSMIFPIVSNKHITRYDDGSPDVSLGLMCPPIFASSAGNIPSFWHAMKVLAKKLNLVFTARFKTSLGMPSQSKNLSSSILPQISYSSSSVPGKIMHSLSWPPSTVAQNIFQKARAGHLSWSLQLSHYQLVSVTPGVYIGMVVQLFEVSSFRAYEWLFLSGSTVVCVSSLDGL